MGVEALQEKRHLPFKVWYCNAAFSPSHTLPTPMGKTVLRISGNRSIDSYQKCIRRIRHLNNRMDMLMKKTNLIDGNRKEATLEKNLSQIDGLKLEINSLKSRQSILSKYENDLQSEAMAARKARAPVLKLLRIQKKQELAVLNKSREAQHRRDAEEESALEELRASFAAASSGMKRNANAFSAPDDESDHDESDYDDPNHPVWEDFPSSC